MDERQAPSQLDKVAPLVEDPPVANSTTDTETLFVEQPLAKPVGLQNTSSSGRLIIGEESNHKGEKTTRIQTMLEKEGNCIFIKSRLVVTSE